MSKKLEQKQQRRLAEERRKAEQRKEALRRNLITIGAAVIVATLVIVLIAMQRDEVGVASSVGVSAEEANCTEIEKHEDQGREHIGVDEPHEPYNSSPPTSGPHYEIPAEDTFFPEAQPPEQLVHNLEHGQIVIWFAPDAPAEIKEQIETLVQQESDATVATPYADIESPYTFVLTAWRNSQACEKVSQEVVDDFRRQFQGHGPEELTPTFDG